MSSIKESFFINFDIQAGNENLYMYALTHRSYIHQHKKKKAEDQQERLEFFGDAVLKFITSHYLMIKFPDMEEGKLTKIRARIISDNSLSKLGIELKLDTFVRVSDSERMSFGHQRPGLLADTFEAILGAMYLDKGIDYTKEWFSNIIETHMSECLDIDYIIDYKTFLQESAQKYNQQLPQYECYKMTGPEHKKTFYFKVTVQLKNQEIIGYGDGENKKAAQQAAAFDCVEILKKKKLI